MWDYDSRLIAEEDWAEYEASLTEEEKAFLLKEPTQEEIERQQKEFDAWFEKYCA